MKAISKEGGHIMDDIYFLELLLAILVFIILFTSNYLYHRIMDTYYDLYVILNEIEFRIVNIEDKLGIVDNIENDINNENE